MIYTYSREQESEIIVGHKRRYNQYGDEVLQEVFSKRGYIGEIFINFVSLQFDIQTFEECLELDTYSDDLENSAAFLMQPENVQLTEQFFIKYEELDIGLLSAFEQVFKLFVTFADKLSRNTELQTVDNFCLFLAFLQHEMVDNESYYPKFPAQEISFIHGKKFREALFGEKASRRVVISLEPEEPEVLSKGLTLSYEPDRQKVLSSFLDKSVVYENKELFSIEAHYYCSTFLQLILTSLYELILSGRRWKKCANCNRYFVVNSRADTKYCDRIDAKTGKSCQQVGATRSYKQRIRGDEFQQIYDRAYKKYHARRKAGNMSADAFYRWSDKAKELRLLLKKGDIKMSAEEFKRALDNILEGDEYGEHTED